MNSGRGFAQLMRAVYAGEARPRARSLSLAVMRTARGLAAVETADDDPVFFRGFSPYCCVSLPGHNHPPRLDRIHRLSQYSFTLQVCVIQLPVPASSGTASPQTSSRSAGRMASSTPSDLFPTPAGMSLHFGRWSVDRPFSASVREEH